MVARAPDTTPAKPEGVVVPLAFVGDDAALVGGLRDHHPGAKAAFFQRYAPYVERIITRVIGYDRELADILQETFLSALASLHTLKDAQALRPWLAQVTTLTARKVLRTRTRRRWLRLFVDADDEARWERPVAEHEPDALRALHAVYAVLGELPADERIAFALRFVEGMELTEVASACAVSLATVKRRLKRAETHFVAEARNRPELGDWLSMGTRWRNQ
jgi:RNA polymerase sigma-70 factor (ECF subfamily)